MDIDLDDARYHLAVMDTAGQEAYRSVIPATLRNAHVAVIVFDVTDDASFKSVGGWIDFVRSVEDSAILVIGNKTDLTEQRCVTADEGMAFADEHQSQYYETSAASGVGIVIAFNALCTMAADKYQKDRRQNIPIGISVDGAGATGARSKRCC
jgi:GTPase SAR1 family protein